MLNGNELPAFPWVSAGLTSLEWDVRAAQVDAEQEQAAAAAREAQARARPRRASDEARRSLVPSGGPRPRKGRLPRRKSHHAPRPWDAPVAARQRRVRPHYGPARPSPLSTAARGQAPAVDLEEERRRKPKARGGALRIGILPAPPTPALLSRPATVDYLRGGVVEEGEGVDLRPGTTGVGVRPGTTGVGVRPGTTGVGARPGTTSQGTRPGTTNQGTRPGTTNTRPGTTNTRPGTTNTRPGTTTNRPGDPDVTNTGAWGEWDGSDNWLRPMTAQEAQERRRSNLLDNLHPERPMTFDAQGKPRSRKDVIQFLQARAAARSATPEGGMDPALFRRAVQHHVPNSRVPPRSQHEAIPVTFNNALDDAEMDVFFMRLEGRGISHFSLPALTTATRHSRGLRVPWARHEDGVQAALVRGARGTGAAAGGAGDDDGVGVDALLSLPAELIEPEPASVLDDVTVTLQFCNNGVFQSCEVYWVGYSGEMVHRRTLRPGEAYMERSFATHPWLVRDPESGRALVVAVGAAAATSQQRYSTVWNPLQPSLSWMIQSAVGAGEVTPELLNQRPATEAARINAGRALLVKQLRDMRRDVQSRYTAGIAAKTGGGATATLSVSFLPKPV